MTLTKKILIILAVIALSLFGIVTVARNRIMHPTLTGNHRTFQVLTIDNKKIRAELADTNAKREQGLSNRKKLGSGDGMLFVFDRPDIYYFWMKDMNFPLDMIWINSNWQIIDISSHIATSTYPKTISPRSRAQYVLEVNAGFAEQNGIQVGDKVQS